MANIVVQKLESAGPKAREIFEEIEKRLQEVQCRAFDLFQQRGRELGHAFEDWLKAEHEVFGWPAAQMAEGTEGYEVEMTLPGYDAQDVQVTATPSEIVVRAALKAESQRKQVLWTEFGSNDVCRRFAMPQPIDVDKIKATLDKGLLRISAAKAALAQMKPISVAA